MLIALLNIRIYKSKFNVKVSQFCKPQNNNLINIRYNDLTIFSVIVKLLCQQESPL